MDTYPFTLFHNGKEIQINSNELIGPVTRLCCTTSFLYILSETKVYRGRIQNVLQDDITVEFWKNNIVDIQIWFHQIYIVTADGSVLTKNANDNDTENWNEIVFEIGDGKKPRISYLKCNSVGNLFVTTTGELFGSGQCGEVLNFDVPKKLSIIPEPVLDISAGDDFFIVLATHNPPSDEENYRHFNTQTSSNLNKYQFPDRIKETHLGSTRETEESDGPSDSLNSSKDSVIDHDWNIEEILEYGQNLIGTHVYSFGASNNGVLGTGDHIKRNGLNNVIGLSQTGVCSISSGKEHNIARTIDGRILHWGLNSQNQVNFHNKGRDFSAPKELIFEQIEQDSDEAYVLDACCGDYRSVLINSSEKIFENGKPTIDRDIITFNNPNEHKNYPLILTSDGFTLLNDPKFVRKYQIYLTSLQKTVRKCLNVRINFNQIKRIHSDDLFSMHQWYRRLLHMLVTCLKTVENFYRGDGQYSDILFFRSTKEMITTFEQYTKYYCDLKSMNYFNDINRNEFGFPSDLDRVYQQPLVQISNIVKFIETLTKNENDPTHILNDKLEIWKTFQRQNTIEIELADCTRTFWQLNKKNAQLLQFKCKSRRVILDSSVPLKLQTFSNSSFILFSDCLCQLGNNLQLALTSMWVKIASQTSLKIITPEKTFVVQACSHEDKMLWYDHLETSILAAIGRPGGKMSNIRVTSHFFSEKHKFSRVKAFGRWKLGVLHGTCYLEYPDGKFYLGTIIDGTIEGYGKMSIPSVGIYEGSFKAGKFHGYGVYEMRNNEIYDGNFRDGMFHGHGFLRTSNYVYIGDFMANSKNGYGILDDMITGEKYMGMFADNKRTGAGICITMDGDYFEGFWQDNKLEGQGVAVFENGNYYDGELSKAGPIGKGKHFLPISKVDGNDENLMLGNIISGNLSGTWNFIRFASAGYYQLNEKFPKFPKSIGQMVPDNNRKWRSLFDNFEEHIFGTTTLVDLKEVWNKIAVYMTNQKAKDTQATKSPQSYFSKNITMLSNFADFSIKSSTSYDKISLKSLSAKLETGSSFFLNDNTRKSYSNETLFERCEQFEKDVHRNHEEIFNKLQSCQLNNFPCSNNGSVRNSFDSISSLNITNHTLDFVPNFGINSLSSSDLNAIKDYLEQAFKDPFHPLCLLNEKISNCFYTSYGCWKVKPTPILSKQAILEWESISIRVYKIVRKLFPALPEKYCSLENSQEIVSHISLLYPIVLSEGIYSTLFVLYANKQSTKDEDYRQKFVIVEKKTDIELGECLSFDSSLMDIVQTDLFAEAIETLKQIKEKYCPKAMLNVLEKSLHLITEAHKSTISNLTNGEQSPTVLAADSIMPLAIFLVLRAGVPHLGAELDLLYDLTGDANLVIEMSGLAGYCYTTIKAAYEHIISNDLFH